MMHTPTLLLVIVLLTSIMAICLGVVGQRAQRDGLRLWSLGIAVHSAAYVLFLLRGQISDGLSVVLANGLIATHLALIIEGVAQFQQRRLPRSLVWGPVPFIIVAFSLLLDNIGARVMLSSLVVSAQSTGLIWLLWSRRRQTPGRGQYFVIAAYLLVLLVMGMRLLATLDGSMQILRITDTHLIQASTFTGVIVTTVLAGLGLVLMTKERADTRNQTLALQDELTGLNNRRAILAQLELHLASARRSQLPLSLLIIDIDHFKEVNDQHGHLSGDQVLREMAHSIRARLRAQDVLGRWGGEEFILLLSDTDAAGAWQLAETVRQSVAQTVFHTAEGQTLTLTISIGLHTRVPAADTNSDSLISAADAALYRAKQNGRNRVEQG